MDLSETLEQERTIKQEVDWLLAVIQKRMEVYFREGDLAGIDFPNAPEILGNESVYARFLMHYDLDEIERLVLILALVPHLMPEVLDVFFVQNSNTNRVFTEFGGITSKQYSGFLPTGFTAAFLLKGHPNCSRLDLLNLFGPNHPFAKFQILTCEGALSGEPELSGRLVLSPESLAYLIRGESFEPQYSSLFPARQLKTDLDWSDLFVNPLVRSELDHIQTWLKHRHHWLEDSGLAAYLQPGFRALFHGPPGTGKTFTASLLGKTYQVPVYRVDLSRMVSKYIGETEKNLEKVFEVAENKDWILFFDEADALFGKRTSTTDAKDRFANQEIAYLLQRIEHFNGLVLLATNLKGNMDDAFARRFQSIVNFQMPGPEQRLQIWSNLANHCRHPFHKEVDLRQLASDFELSGGSINNVMHSAVLLMLEAGEEAIRKHQVYESIRKEFGKVGKTVL